MVKEKRENQADNLKIKNPSRRAFVKKAIIGGIAVASAAEIAKVAASLVEGDVARKAYQDEVEQDRIMTQKSYVLMSEEEKEKMVKILVDNYKSQTSF